MSDMAVSNVVHRITVEEYHRMDEAGVFPHDRWIELVEGKLMETLVPMNPPYADVGDRTRVRPRLPITLGDLAEPQPHFSIVKVPRSLYRSRHSEAAEIFRGYRRRRQLA